MDDLFMKFFAEGYNFAEHGRYLEAVAAYEKALAIDPNSANAWNNRGLALSDLGRHAEALASYDKALAINSRDDNTWLNRGNTQMSLGHHSEAVVSFDRAIVIKSDDEAVWNNRGVALDNLGRYAEAVASFDRALAIKPDFVPARINHGMALNNLGRHAEAVASFDKVIALNPSNTQARKNREFALQQQEKKLNITSFDKLGKRRETGPKPKIDFRQIPPTPWDKGYKILNRWEIIDIKKGGMGIVFITQDHEWDQIFAIKTFQDKYLWDEDIIQRFMAEAETWTELERHTNIVFASMVQRIEGKPLLFLEYIDSGNLEQFIGKLTIEETLDLAIQFCTGMEYVYQKLGVIHRDIKPGNVMVQKDPRFRFGYAFKITDFGLVKVLGNEFLDESDKVSTGMGTLPFMPPEQFPDRIQEKFSFKGQMTTRADIYSFGVMLYLLLTMKLPFDSLTEIFTKSPEKPKHLNQKIPEHLDILIIKCLEKNPDRRYTDFTELKEKLVEMYSDLSGESYAEIGEKEQLTEGDWSNKGSALKELGKNQEAIVCFDNSLEINPRSPAVWSNKGLALKNLGKLQEAIECFDKALEFDPRCAAAWSNKGLVLVELGTPQEAIGFLNKALEINSISAVVWINKGLALAELEKYQGAIECWDKALEINPRDDYAWYNQGVTFKKLGKSQEAIKCFDKALEINPRFAAALGSKGDTLVKLGKPQEAIRCFEKFIDVAPPEYSADVEKIKKIITKLG